MTVNDPGISGTCRNCPEKRDQSESVTCAVKVDHYTWVDIGSSYLISDLLAAFLYAQLENMDQINRKENRHLEFLPQGFGPPCQ